MVINECQSQTCAFRNGPPSARKLEVPSFPSTHSFIIDNNHAQGFGLVDFGGIRCHYYSPDLQADWCLVSRAFQHVHVRANACENSSFKSLTTVASPNLGCIWPPDQTEFIAGQVFDIRVEVQAPQNGSMPYNGGKPSSDFKIEIGHTDSDLKPLTEYFGIPDAESEDYSFK